MSDVIKFEFNQPVEVALRFIEPRVFPSQFQGGDDRHMFSTTDGRVMYVTPLTSARIKSLNLAQGECFFICKRINGRITDYDVTREATEPVAPAASRPPVHFGGTPKTFPPLKSHLPERLYYAPPVSEHEPPSTLEEQLQASIDMLNRRKVGNQGDGTLAVVAPPAPRPQVQPQPVKAAEPSRLAPAVAEFSARLVVETTALVDSYAAALKTASERHGGLVKADDVRTFVVTAYINATKQGGRNAA